MRILSLIALVGFGLVATGCGSNRALIEQQRAELNVLREDLAAAYTEMERLRRMGADFERCEAELAEMESRLRDALSGRGGERGETVAVLPTDIYFQSGSAELSPEGVRLLTDIARRLRTEYAGRELRIEGYTDDRPIGDNLRRQFPSNWELSAARAGMVARHLQWTHHLDGSKIEIVGLSQYHPVASNATPEGRQQNRRVRIAVMGQ